MAIEYERVNWDTTKYVNPTNMNQMDAGIKAACDGVDENSSAITAINSTLDNLKADYLEFNTAYGKLELHKKGGCVSMYGILSNMPANTSLNLGKLPSEFASNFNYGFGFFLNNASPYEPLGSVWLGGQGDVTIYKPLGTTIGYVAATYTNFTN